MPQRFVVGSFPTPTTATDTYATSTFPKYQPLFNLAAYGRQPNGPIDILGESALKLTKDTPLAQA